MSTQDGGIGGEVVIRAFRGTRRESVYREHVLPESAFAEVVVVGRRAGLAVLESLDRLESRKLDKRQAAQLADEVTTVRTSGALLALDDHLVVIAEVARWCAHASGGSWLKIARV